MALSALNALKHSMQQKCHGKCFGTLEFRIKY